MITFTVQNKLISFIANEFQPVSITNVNKLVSFQVVTGSVNINGANLYSEALMGVVDGENKIFTTSNNFKVASTQVFVNGLRQKRGSHYSETGPNEITFSDAPSADGFEDELLINYTKE